MNSKNNIIVIMSDQLTPFMLGIYGNMKVETNNIDSLAKDSVIFENAYTPCPLCAPARAGFVTGKYTSELGCYDNASSFSSEIPTFMHYLSDYGYETVLSGKMHFIGPDQLHGFSKRLTTDIYPSGFDWTPRFIDKNKHIMQTKEEGNAKNYKYKRLHPKKWDIHLQYDEETHMKAKEYIYNKANEQEDSSSSYFLCISYHHPHDPFNMLDEYQEKYKNSEFEKANLDDSTNTIMDKWLNDGFHRTDNYPIDDYKEINRLRQAYAASVSYIDKKVGEIIELLKDTNQYNSTTIIFTSDHGDMLGERKMIQKRCFYEWSSKIPLTIKYPKSKGKNQRRREIVSLIDLAPTILDIAGCKAKYDTEFEGSSLNTQLSNDRVVFSESHGEGIMWPCFMARKKEYKLIYIYKHEKRLFNIKEDPKETCDLIGDEKYKDIANYLINAIEERFNSKDILKSIERSVKRRTLIKNSMKKNNINWDFDPKIDYTKKYIR